MLDGDTGEVETRIRVGGGPSGVALHEAKGRLYVMDRFDNTLSIVDVVANPGLALPGAPENGPEACTRDDFTALRRALRGGRGGPGPIEPLCRRAHPHGGHPTLVCVDLVPDFPRGTVWRGRLGLSPRHPERRQKRAR